MKILQMNLISLLKPHQSNDVTVLAIPSSNFLTTMRSQTRAIPSTQFAKNIYINQSSHCPHKGNGHPLDDFIEMQYK